MDAPDNRPAKTAQIISLEEFRARRDLRAFHARVGRLRERVADMRKSADREAPLLALRDDPPG
jgi:polyhydroxyalkanoate synthesis regulator phasin